MAIDGEVISVTPQAPIQPGHISYVLITPARNEEAHIRHLIEAVTGQTLTPAKWVIVNDGSTDQTAAIVREYLDRYAWIELLELPGQRDRSFAAKAHCFNAGYKTIRHLKYDVVGNLDADVTFEHDYLEFLTAKFSEDPTLGVTGTVFVENDYNTSTHSFEGEMHVAGGCQLFRKACFEQIGGYIPAKIGVDWIAVTTARMMGWETRAFREKAFTHHRPLGTAGRSRLAAARFYGEKDYLLGWHPLYELFRVVHQSLRDPLTGFSIALGYGGALVKGGERLVSPELMRFHRAEQLTKLRSLLKTALSLKRVDPFLVRAR